MSGDDVEFAEFAVFADTDKGPMWRQFFPDLKCAKTKAQELAIEEGVEFFVFSFMDNSEVARFFPRPKTPNGCEGALRLAAARSPEKV